MPLNPLALALIRGGGALSQAGAPSRTPISLLGGLSQGLSVGADAFQQAENFNLRNQFLRAKIDQQKAEADRLRVLSQLRENSSFYRPIGVPASTSVSQDNISPDQAPLGQEVPTVPMNPQLQRGTPDTVEGIDQEISNLESQLLNLANRKSEAGAIALPEGINAIQPQIDFIQGRMDRLLRKRERLEDSPQKSLDIAKKEVELQSKIVDQQEKQRELAEGKSLSASETLKVNEGALIPELLADLDQKIEENESLFGPVRGRIGTANPFDTPSQVMNADLRAKSQAFGRYMEGGVLRKEDEEKYRRMFPQLGDTKEVALGKLKVVRDLLFKKFRSDVKALKAGDQNVANFEEVLKDLEQTMKSDKPASQSFSQEDLEFTAKKYGISVEEVKERLNK